MPLFSPFQRTALATVLAVVAAAATLFQPLALDGRKSGEHGIAATDGRSDSSIRGANLTLQGASHVRHDHQ
jgi:hypothetical protein